MKKQLSLFLEPESPPPAGSEVLDFDIILKGGGNVSVHYDRHYFISRACLEYYGDSISSTGYYCFFMRDGCLIDDPDDVVIETARGIAERLREERINELAQEFRRRKRKNKEIRTG